MDGVRGAAVPRRAGVHGTVGIGGLYRLPEGTVAIYVQLIFEGIDSDVGCISGQCYKKDGKR